MRRKKRIEDTQDVSMSMPLFKYKDFIDPISPSQFQVNKVDNVLACKLNQQWHSVLPLFSGTIKVSYTSEFDGKYYAVAIWSNPVARALPQDTYLELRRFAISSNAPKNTASFMIGKMTRLLKDDFPNLTTLISYQDTEKHFGTIYKASNWSPIITNRNGQGWNSRKRNVTQSDSIKVRWEYNY